jgi:hypothetical protein
LPVVALLSGVGVANLAPATRLALAALLLVPAVHYDLPMARVFDALGLGGAWWTADAVANTTALAVAFVGSALLATRATSRVSGR